MRSLKISLNSIEKVKSFVNIISEFKSEFDLTSGRYIVDAKSIMGIFSLDLSKPIELTLHDVSLFDEVQQAIANFIEE